MLRSPTGSTTGCFPQARSRLLGDVRQSDVNFDLSGMVFDMPNENIQVHEATCKSIVAGIQDPCSWSWDDRFGAVLTQCDTEQSSHLHQLLREHFPPAWTPSNCTGAPSRIGEIAETLGGIQQGQELFLTDTNQHEMVLGVAWWPWGNGQCVSFRFFLWPTPDSNSEVNKELCNWFGIVRG